MCFQSYLIESEISTFFITLYLNAAIKSVKRNGYCDIYLNTYTFMHILAWTNVA